VSDSDNARLIAERLHGVSYHLRRAKSELEAMMEEGALDREMADSGNDIIDIVSTLSVVNRHTAQVAQAWAQIAYAREMQ
jgi:hypothetical protein